MLIISICSLFLHMLIHIPIRLYLHTHYTTSIIIPRYILIYACSCTISILIHANIPIHMLIIPTYVLVHYSYKAKPAWSLYLHAHYSYICTYMLIILYQYIHAHYFYTYLHTCSLFLSVHTCSLFLYLIMHAHYSYTYVMISSLYLPTRNHTAI